MSRRKGKIEISRWKVGEADNFQALYDDEYTDQASVTPENEDPEPEQPADVKGDSWAINSTRRKLHLSRKS